MSLIICPECGKEFSDRAASCPNCGCPTNEAISINKENADKKKKEELVCPMCGAEAVGEDGYCDACGMNVALYRKQKKQKKDVEFSGNPYVICPHCGKHNPTGIFTCQYCKQKISAKEYRVVDDNKVDVKRLKNTPYCPKCSSTNLQYLGEDNVGGREAKTKTVISLNLNPLKPFTLFNQKEKVVKKARAGFDLDRWRCADCGKVFTTMKY